MSIEFDLDQCLVTVGAWRLKLADVRKLWLLDAVRAGIPDEHEYRYVVETEACVYLGPSLSLPTQARREALERWTQAGDRLYVLQRLGWPWAWGAWRWSWCAMRGQVGEFGLATFELVRRGAEIQGPLTLSAALKLRED